MEIRDETEVKSTPGTGTLKHGLKIGKEVHQIFVIREGTMEDAFAAEDIAPVEQTLKFDAALLCQRLVSIGTFPGPFTLTILGRLKAADFNHLRRAMAEVDRAGEPEPAPGPDA